MGQSAGQDWKIHSFNCGIVAYSFGGNNGLVRRVRHGFGVGTVRREHCADGVWDCLVDLGETRGRRQALALAGLG